MQKLFLRTLLTAAAVAVAAPSFASTVVPLCGDEKHGEKNEEKNKSDKKEANEKKKPVNQG